MGSRCHLAVCGMRPRRHVGACWRPDAICQTHRPRARAPAIASDSGGRATPANHSAMGAWAPGSAARARCNRRSGCTHGVGAVAFQCQQDRDVILPCIRIRATPGRVGGCLQPGRACDSTGAVLNPDMDAGNESKVFSVSSAGPNAAARGSSGQQRARGGSVIGSTRTRVVVVATWMSLSSCQVSGRRSYMLIFGKQTVCDCER
jgi:hypothetical protein